MRRFLLPLLCFAATAAYAGSGVAQDPVAAFPHNYSLALDNNVVSVFRVHYGPHEHVGVHDHSSFPTVYVYLSNSGPVRFAHDEKPPFVLTRPPVEKGSFRVSPGRIERHSVENLSDTSSDFLRVEMKQIPLGTALPPFRGKAPESLAHSSNSIAFASLQLTIRRVLCTASCPLQGSTAPSLLVALSPLKVSAGDAPQQARSMHDGEIVWDQNQLAGRLIPTSGQSAHLLEITFAPLTHPIH